VRIGDSAFGHPDEKCRGEDRDARAGLLGGTLTAGPGPRGGFVVTARLPTPTGTERQGLT
jgi:hypothetical protein